MFQYQCQSQDIFIPWIFRHALWHTISAGAKHFITIHITPSWDVNMRMHWARECTNERTKKRRAHWLLCTHFNLITLTCMTLMCFNSCTLLTHHTRKDQTNDSYLFETLLALTKNLLSKVDLLKQTWLHGAINLCDVTNSVYLVTMFVQELTRAFFICISLLHL